MRKRRLLGAICGATATVVSVGLLTIVPTAAGLTPPVGMTATHLPTWQTNGVVWALAEHNGIVYVGGTFSAIRPPGAAAGESEQQALNFATFNAATGAPTACRPPFTIGSGVATVRALAVSPDGQTLYAGGSFSSVDGHNTSRVAAIDIGSCSPRTDFVAQNFNGLVKGMDASTDALFVGGEFTSVAGQPRGRFAALDTTNGALLPWRTDVTGTATGSRYSVTWGSSIAVLAGGQNVAIGGNFTEVQGTTSDKLAVVNATTGNLVRAYPRPNYTCRSGNDPFCEQRSVVQNIYADDSGSYTAHEGQGGFDGRKAFNLNLSQRWRDTCLGANQDVIVYQQVLYSVHHAHNCASNNNGGFGELGNRDDLKDHQHMTAQSINGSSAPPMVGWFPDTNPGIGEGIGPRAVVVSQSAGTDYMWIGGDFTRVGYPWGFSPYQQGLTRMAGGQQNDASTPQTVGGLTGSAPQANRVNLSWTASRDYDDSLLTYQVLRDGEVIGSTGATSFFWVQPAVSFTDTEAPGGSRNYRIRAVDGAGNSSALSAAVTVNVPGTTGPPPPTDVSGLADAYVNEGAPGTNYGTSSYLAVRGSLAYEAYLRYNVPAAPDGFVLQSAELRVRTSTQNFAASTDSHDVRPITGAWTETGATYNNRPGLSSTVLGTLPPVSELNTDYTITLDPAWLAGRLGQTINLAMTSEGTDNVWLWSREHSSGGPRLHLVWGAP